MTRSALKRSVINRSIQEAEEAFLRFGLHLPPFAWRKPEEWEMPNPDDDEIRDCMLGWDVTDFGSGTFERIGRTLFTLRNGTMRKPGYAKIYAEKLLYDPEGQRAPAHFHRTKMEDICCRSGGNILVQLTGVNSDDSPSDQPLVIKVDGTRTKVEPRGIIRLKPGMSLCIPPRTIHQFWGEEGCGITISSEVSSVCDDWSDNFFLEPAERFPGIEEDAPRTHYLCHEYPVVK